MKSKSKIEVLDFSKKKEKSKAKTNEPPKRPRGRPRKQQQVDESPKKPRGRPRKQLDESPKNKKAVGRPKDKVKYSLRVSDKRLSKHEDGDVLQQLVGTRIHIPDYKVGAGEEISRGIILSKDLKIPGIDGIVTEVKGLGREASLFLIDEHSGGTYARLAYRVPAARRLLKQVKKKVIMEAKANEYSIGGRIPVGYWRTKEEATLPNPTKLVDINWDKVERKKVARYLRDQPGLRRYKGYADCRICAERIGDKCQGDKKYNWPEGLVHYVLKHAVKPPEEFLKWVRKRIRIMEQKNS